MGCASSTPVEASPPPSATATKSKGSPPQVKKEDVPKSVSFTPPSASGIGEANAKPKSPKSAPAPVAKLPSPPTAASVTPDSVTPEDRSVSSSNSTDNLSDMSGASASMISGLDLSVPQKGTLDSSHHRRRSRQNLTHADSRVGLNEIICGDLKNPNLVRIE